MSKAQQEYQELQKQQKGPLTVGQKKKACVGQLDLILMYLNDGRCAWVHFCTHNLLLHLNGN